MRRLTGFLLISFNSCMMYLFNLVLTWYNFDETLVLFSWTITICAIGKFSWVYLKILFEIQCFVYIFWLIIILFATTHFGLHSQLDICCLLWVMKTKDLWRDFTMIFLFVWHWRWMFLSMWLVAAIMWLMWYVCMIHAKRWAWILYTRVGVRGCS